MTRGVKQLPVLFLDDVVLLPGMVVPIELDEPAQAAVDAARAADLEEILVAPRIDGHYATYGVVASLEKVGAVESGSADAHRDLTRDRLRRITNFADLKFLRAAEFAYPNCLHRRSRASILLAFNELPVARSRSAMALLSSVRARSSALRAAVKAVWRSSTL